MSESLSSALKEVDLNSKKISNKEEEDVEAKKETSSTSSDPTACSSCSLANATKRCSKRHAKCLKKLFCDKVCETQGHKTKSVPKREDCDDPEADAENGVDEKELTDAEKAAKAKKKKAKKADVARKKQRGSTVNTHIPNRDYE